MENNQQSNSASNASNKQGSTSFSNKQQGLPAEKDRERSNRFDDSTGGTEQHSESSKPEAENETLGTP
jgi:hypothetical protein